MIWFEGIAPAIAAADDSDRVVPGIENLLERSKGRTCTSSVIFIWPEVSNDGERTGEFRDERRPACERIVGRIAETRRPVSEGTCRLGGAGRGGRPQGRRRCARGGTC